MPVKITTVDNSTDPRVISLDAFKHGRANFSLHYFYTDTASEYTGDVIQIQWEALQNAVTNYMTVNSVPENQVALRFVHCFDLAQESLYMRLQICRMVPSTTPPPPGTSMVYDLISTGAKWYEIKQDSFAPTVVTTMENTEYLNNFYYKEEPQAATMQVLSSGPAKYVKNLTMPWASEVKLMYEENGSPINAWLNLASCSYMESPVYSNVLWPHGLVLFLSDDTNDPYLDNDDSIVVFHNKGADMATVCPPTCNVYNAPAV